MLVAAGLLIAAGLFARNKESQQLVDSGTFSVLVNGTRIATETFRIQQGPEGSVTSSEFSTVEGQAPSAQRSELRVASNGDLQRYEWHELAPGKAQATVEPSQQFLMERMTPDPPDKPQQKPFLVPASTLVLDDFFFVHREILAWRYLAQGCAGGSDCKLTKTQFGVVIPRQAVSSMVTMEYAGKEGVTLHGSPVQLDRFNLTADGVDWSLWLDSNMKLMRILIPSEHTEVVRD